MDAVVVDYKGSGEELFQRRQTMTVSAEPIKETLLELKAQKIHTELTDLIIPQVGEDLGEAKRLCDWLYDNLGPDVPIQFTRFHPDYKMLDVPSTPYELLVKHHEIATKAGLNYAYIGNVPGSPQEHTYCPGCHEVVIERHGFMITGWNLDANYRAGVAATRSPSKGRGRPGSATGASSPSTSRTRSEPSSGTGCALAREGRCAQVPGRC